MTINPGPRCKIDPKFRCGRTKERHLSFCPDNECASNTKLEMAFYDSKPWKDYIEREKLRLKGEGRLKKNELIY